LRIGKEIEVERREGDSKGDVVKRNVNALRAAIFGLSSIRKRASTGASSGESQRVEEDPFYNLEKNGKLIAPPYDLLFLSMLPENNTEIAPCVDAITVNVEGFGWRMEPRIPVSEATPVEVLRTLAEEAVKVENFLAGACDGTFAAFREAVRKDLEITGNRYVEFVEEPVTGALHGLVHLPAWTMRISVQDESATEYVKRVLHKQVRFSESKETKPVELAEGEVELRKALSTEVSFEIREEIRYKRFRRYAQVRGKKVTWFKELGDPRLISSLDGHVVTREELLRQDQSGKETLRFTLAGDQLVARTGLVGWPVSCAANPVSHGRNYCARSPYGIPKYAGNFFAIMGSRASEEINYSTFKNNNVPSVAITVSNGRMDDDSLQRIEEFVEASIAGDDNYSKILLLEAEPVMEGMRDPGAMKIDLTPLTREQHTDAMFVNYKRSNDDSVRRAWRLPPIFLGMSEDFTSKTIDPARR